MSESQQKLLICSVGKLYVLLSQCMLNIRLLLIQLGIFVYIRVIVTGKFSYHIVINGYLLRSSKHCEVIYNEVIEILRIETGLELRYLRIVVDASIYKSLQQFRLLFSTKRDSKAHKMLHEQWKLLPDTDAPLITHVHREPFESSREKWVVMMRESLVGLCEDYNTFVEVPLAISEPSHSQPMNGSPINETALTELMSRTFLSAFTYQIVNSNGSIVLLKRKQSGLPYSCPICRRSHQNENPFLIICGPRQAVYYVCRRAMDARESERSTLVGYLNPDGREITIPTENGDEGDTYISHPGAEAGRSSDIFASDVVTENNDPSAFVMFEDNGMRPIMTENVTPAVEVTELASVNLDLPAAPIRNPDQNSTRSVSDALRQVEQMAPLTDETSSTSSLSGNVIEMIEQMSRTPYVRDDDNADDKPAKKEIPAHLIMNRPEPDGFQMEGYVSCQFADRGAYMIDSQLGTGKTTLIMNMILEKDPRICAILTPRKMYARSIWAEINNFLKDRGVSDDKLFTCYTDIEKKTINLNETPRLVIQMESLHHLLPYFNEFLENPSRNRSVCDILICDESESLLKQFSSQQTMGANLGSCARIFQWLVASSHLVICCDAFLQERTKRIFRMMLPRKPYIHRNYQHPVRRRAYPIPDIKTFFSLIRHKVIVEGKKVVICCSSKYQLRVLKGIMGDEVFGLYYDGECDEATRKSLSDVRGIWSDTRVRFVAYTSVITVGVNFDVPNIFDCLFVYGSSPACVVRDLFQGTMRVRHLTDNEMYYTLFTRPIGKHDQWSRSIWPSKISDDLDHGSDNVMELLRRTNICIENSPTEIHWLRMCHIYNVQELNVSKFFYQQVFEYYLSACNYEMCVTPGVDIPIIPLLKSEVPNYHAIPLLTHAQANTVFDNIRNGIKNEYGQVVIDKYNFSVMFQPDVSEEIRAAIWDKFYKSGFAHLKHIHAEKNLTEQQWTEKNFSSLMMYFNRPSLHAYDKIKKLNDILGIPNSCPTSFSISRNELLEKFTKYDKNRWYEFQKIFGYKTTAHKDIAYYNIKQIYKEWSGSHVESSKAKRKIIRGITTETKMVKMTAHKFGNRNIWDLIRTDSTYADAAPPRVQDPDEPPVLPIPPPRLYRMDSDGTVISRAVPVPPPRTSSLRYIPPVQIVNLPSCPPPPSVKAHMMPKKKVTEEPASPTDTVAKVVTESVVKPVSKVVPPPVKRIPIKVPAPVLQQ